MNSEPSSLYLGLDAGSSGIRAICIDDGGGIVASAKYDFEDRKQARLAPVWKRGIIAVMSEIMSKIEPGNIAAIAVDGQSGTLLLCDDRGAPLSQPMFYNEPADAQALTAILPALRRPADTVPPTLGRAVQLWAQDKPSHFHLVHQADWLAGLFSGRFDISDENNALKLGYDPGSRDWLFNARRLPFDRSALPEILPPAACVGPAVGVVAKDLGLPATCQVYTGSTDGMAGFIAASGLDDVSPGIAVTSLGTTLVIKALSSARVENSEYGIYSHKLFDNWVAGGASNSGGGALLRHFSAAEITDLSDRIDPDVATGLDYYPLIGRGERFPVCDPALEQRTVPRPDDDALFLAGLFESIARIEKTGFDLLQAHGVPYPKLIKTVGGGSYNKTWLKIRQRILGAEVIAARQTEAAFGAALLARLGQGTCGTDC